MTRYMYDATSENAAVLLQFKPTLVAIYLTGTPDIRWTSTQVALFPHANFVRIDQAGETSPQFAANVQDVEPGAWTPASVPGWMAKSTAPVPTAYCDRDQLPDVMAVWKGAIWLAAPGLTDVEAIALAATNKQIVAVQNVFAGPYDRSIIIDEFWPERHPVNPPVTPPVNHEKAPAPPGEWEKAATLVGIGLDGNLWQTIYNPVTGVWSTPVKL